MTLVRVTPRVGGLPELGTYRCDGCNDVQTVERPASASRACGESGSNRPPTPLLLAMGPGTSGDGKV
jgi:hypothetical protein